jgi:hypothetical protein
MADVIYKCLPLIAVKLPDATALVLRSPILMHELRTVQSACYNRDI